METCSEISVIFLQDFPRAAFFYNPQTRGNPTLSRWQRNDKVSSFIYCGFVITLHDTVMKCINNFFAFHNN
jgi:hypothetical protein